MLGNMSHNVIDFTEFRNRRELSDYVVNPMGAAVVDETSNYGEVQLYGSSSPQEHTNEAIKTQEIVDNYRSSEEGQDFFKYVVNSGRRLMDIKAVGAGDLGEKVVAAIVHNGREGIFLSNYDGLSFEDRITEFAESSGLDENSAMEYVLAHEHAHVAGINTESGAEGFIKEYFQERADHYARDGNKDLQNKYEKLANVAEQREELQKAA
jgi:hypothetical protein